MTLSLLVRRVLASATSVTVLTSVHISIELIYETTVLLITTERCVWLLGGFLPSPKLIIDFSYLLYQIILSWIFNYILCFYSVLLVFILANWIMSSTSLYELHFPVNFMFLVFYFHMSLDFEFLLKFWPLVKIFLRGQWVSWGDGGSV